MQLRIDAGGEPDLPPIDMECTHIIGALFEVGPASANGMSIQPISWMEIDAYQRSIGVSLSPWVVRTLRTLSAAYVAEFNESSAHDAPIPWVPEGTTERRERIAKHIRNVFRG